VLKTVPGAGTADLYADAPVNRAACAAPEPGDLCGYVHRERDWPTSVSG